jgi:hypothetical protein
MVRRTSCLQSNCLQKLISKNASDSPQELDAASREIDDLKSAVAILQRRVSRLQAAEKERKWGRLFRQSKPESRSAERELASAICRHLWSEHVPFTQDTRERPQYPRKAELAGPQPALPFVPPPGSRRDSRAPAKPSPTTRLTYPGLVWRGES